MIFYTTIIKPLLRYKTLLIKLISIRGNARKKIAGRLRVLVPTPKELNTFYYL